MLKIGYTTGVFDMFHIGHLNLLRQAKGHCDILIVGVTTDEETFRVKNKKPIISYEERVEIVNAIKYVDHAIPETDVNKIRAWEELNFDILFKGSDWKKTKEFDYYRKFFKEKGVEVKFFDYTEGISSTYLRQKISGDV